MTSDDSSMEENFEIFEESFYPFLKEKSFLISTMLEGKKLLEVGCGTGDLLQFFQSGNFEVMGSDYSNVYLNKARELHPQIKFFKADLLDNKAWTNLENQFDSIVASEVFEHIENNEKALHNIKSILKPGGVLIITVPAFNFLYSPHDKKIGHYRRYTKKTAQAILTKSGFSVEKVRYWNLLGFFGWLINFKILKKDLRNTTKFSLISILCAWLKIESKIKMPFGLTVILKARKPEVV